MENFATKEQLAAVSQQLTQSNGQLIALGAAIRALLLSHPNREYALDVVSAELMRWEAFGLNSQVPDSMLKGFERAKATLLPTAADLASIPPTPGQDPGL